MGLEKLRGEKMKLQDALAKKKPIFKAKVSRMGRKKMINVPARNSIQPGDEVEVKLIKRGWK